MKYTKLKQKEVINVCDGRSLRYVADLIIDCASGAILSIVVPGSFGIKSLFKSQCYIIPWSAICKLGSDVILVDINAKNCFMNA